jgi:hypothetical protein
MRRFALSLVAALVVALATSSPPSRADEPAPTTTSEAPAPTTPPGTEAETTDGAPTTTPPALDPAFTAAIEAMVERKLEEKLAEKKSAGFFDDERQPVSLSWRGDFFTKFLVRNNQSGGCVSYGNPSPEGDNFSGDNGICS